MKQTTSSYKLEILMGLIIGSILALPIGMLLFNNNLQYALIRSFLVILVLYVFMIYIYPRLKNGKS